MSNCDKFSTKMSKSKVNSMLAMQNASADDEASYSSESEIEEMEKTANKRKRSTKASDQKSRPKKVLKTSNSEDDRRVLLSPKDEVDQITNRRIIGKNDF